MPRIKTKHSVNIKSITDGDGNEIGVKVEELYKVRSQKKALNTVFPFNEE